MSFYYISIDTFALVLYNYTNIYIPKVFINEVLY